MIFTDMQSNNNDENNYHHNHHFHNNLSLSLSLPPLSATFMMMIIALISTSISFHKNGLNIMWSIVYVPILLNNWTVDWIFIIRTSLTVEQSDAHVHYAGYSFRHAYIRVCREHHHMKCGYSSSNETTAESARCSWLIALYLRRPPTVRETNVLVAAAWHGNILLYATIRIVLTIIC